MAPPDITKIDLYELLGISHEACKKEIVSAYRKKARSCHPDKNPDNPKAAELFHELARALELLTDAAARAAYDKTLKAKKAAELRHRELDSKRKKLKEDLQAREESYDQQKIVEAAAQKNLQAEIERLRKEGSKLLEEEQELLRQTLKQETVTIESEDDDDDVAVSPKIKVKWRSKKDDESNGGYNKNNLEAFFSQYGDVAFILLSSKKSGSAIIEFEKTTPKLLEVEKEVGLPQNQLSVTWLSGKPKLTPPTKDSSHQGYSTYLHTSEFAKPVDTSDNDFESLVLRKMRQAEERKRLIEQMQREDEEEEKR